MSRKKKTDNYRGSSKGQFAQMHRSTMDTAAWRALSPTAQALFPWLKLEWKGPASNYNGKLSLSYRAAAKAMGISKPETIGKAFRELQAKGFVVVHQVAALGVDGMGKSFEYEVKEARIANPDGRGGKTKSHPAKRNSPIPRNGTVLPTPSRETVHPIPRNGTV